jgi:cell division protein FtsL
VRERDIARARELFRTLGLGVLVLMPLLLHVWQQVGFVETAYAVAELRAERQELQIALRKIRLERATQESLERIEARARRSGMIQPPPEAVITVVEDRGAGGEVRP